MKIRYTTKSISLFIALVNKEEWFVIEVDSKDFEAALKLVETVGTLHEITAAREAISTSGGLDIIIYPTGNYRTLGWNRYHTKKWSPDTERYKFEEL